MVRGIRKEAREERKDWGEAGGQDMSCPAFCDPVDCSRPGFPVRHYLLEFAQTHVH